MIHRSVKYLKLSISIRNVNEEEQVALWREGRRREPMPVEIDLKIPILIAKEAM